MSVNLVLCKSLRQPPRLQMLFVAGDGGFGQIPAPSHPNMHFLLRLVIFWWKILRLLPYHLFPLLSAVWISVSGHYIFRFILSPTRLPPPPPLRQIWDHLFTPQPGGWKRFLLPDSLLHPALSTTMPSPALWEEKALSWLCFPVLCLD